MIALVALAGGLGAGLRHLVDTWARSLRTPGALGTVIVNVTGSFVLGLTVAALPDGDVRAVVGTGLLGGYTTFSAASLEAVELARTSRAAAVAHAAGMLALGLAAAGLGLLVGSFPG